MPAEEFARPALRESSGLSQMLPERAQAGQDAAIAIVPGRHQRRALRVGFPTFGALLFSLGFLGLSGAGLNLFHVVAVTLLLGVSVDYGVFFAEKGRRAPATMFAVILCSLSTLLSFGMLALCRTPLLRSFGMTLFIGVVAALVLSPVAAGGRAKEEA